MAPLVLDMVPHMIAPKMRPRIPLGIMKLIRLRIRRIGIARAPGLRIPERLIIDRPRLLTAMGARLRALAIRFRGALPAGHPAGADDEAVPVVAHFVDVPLLDEPARARVRGHAAVQGFLVDPQRAALRRRVPVRDHAVGPRGGVAGFAALRAVVDVFDFREFEEPVRHGLDFGD